MKRVCQSTDCTQHRTGDSNAVVCQQNMAGMAGYMMARRHMRMSQWRPKRCVISSKSGQERAPPVPNTSSQQHPNQQWKLVNQQWKPLAVETRSIIQGHAGTRPQQPEEQEDCSSTHHLKPGATQVTRTACSICSALFRPGQASPASSSFSWSAMSGAGAPRP